jgi:hypothetical protein
MIAASPPRPERVRRIRRRIASRLAIYVSAYAIVALTHAIVR